MAGRASATPVRVLAYPGRAWVLIPTVPSDLRELFAFLHAYAREANNDYGEDDFEGETLAIALQCGRCLLVEFLGRHGLPTDWSSEMAVPTNEPESGADQAEEKREAAAVSSRSGGPPRLGRSASLKTDRGLTSIADTVVEKVAGIATREVRGVYGMGGGTARAIGCRDTAGWSCR